MRALIPTLILWNVLFPQAPSEDDELELLSGKIEFYLQEKGWKLVDKLDQGKVIYHHWRNNGHFVKLSFYCSETKEEAAKRLQDDLAGVRAEFGPGSKAQDLGDEAYSWEGIKNGQALVNFRTGRVIVAVVGPSIVEVKDCARRIAGLLGRGSVAASSPDKRIQRSARATVRCIRVYVARPVTLPLDRPHR